MKQAIFLDRDGVINSIIFANSHDEFITAIEESLKANDKKLVLL